MENLLTEILYCDLRGRNNGKVAIVTLSYAEGMFNVITQGLRVNPNRGQRKKPTKKVRLESVCGRSALYKFDEVLIQKQKIGFRFLNNGESLDVPFFKEAIETNKNSSGENNKKSIADNLSAPEKFRKLPVF